MRRNPYEDSVDHPARPAPPRTASTNGLHSDELQDITVRGVSNASRQPDELRGELSDVKYELVVAGKSDEENLYRKGRALQTHLPGYENPSTLMLLGKREVQFVVIASKAKVLQPPLEASDGSDDKKVEVVQTIGEGNKVGVLPKDKMLGKFVTEWQNVLKERTRT
ncbi:FACT complex subunit spt16 [Rhodotorula toruloides]